LSVCRLRADHSERAVSGRGKTYRIKGFRLLTLREMRRKRCRAQATLCRQLHCNAWVAAY
jgi:hypothetical protein